jgi:2-polyprenyl-6-methoxyphenol hydroxylase-like FAD-dependent oxidoreductase
VPVRRLQGWTRIVTRMFGPRWAVVGNAGDFIDPIFSSGVMLAMESATLAAECVDRQLAGDRVDWLREYQEVIKGATDVFRTFVEAWYRGDLVRVLFATEQSDPVRRAITSVLGGNVLNRNNSLVRNGENGLRALVRALEHRGGAPRSTP